jgi:3-hexulose-6-phosphate synthase
MKLQLALDLVNIPEAIEVVKEVEEHIGMSTLNQTNF